MINLIIHSIFDFHDLHLSRIVAHHVNLLQLLAELIVGLPNFGVKSLWGLLVERGRACEHKILWVYQLGVSDLVGLRLRIQVSLRSLIRLVHDYHSAKDEGTNNGL